jgi:mannosyltransferase
MLSAITQQDLISFCKQCHNNSIIDELRKQDLMRLPKKLVFHQANIAFIVVFLIAFVLRLPLLSGSFWLDEAAQVLESARPLAQQLQITQDFQPPLIHLLVHFLLMVSSSEWWLRLGAALIPGMITVWAIWRIGQRLTQGKSAAWIGVLAALFLATSSFHIFYSQELRPYALPAMWAALSWLVIIGSDLHTAKKKKSLLARLISSPWFFYMIYTIAGLYSSYLYPFILFGQGLYLISIKRDDWKKWGASLGCSALAFLPWVPEFLNQLHAGQDLRKDLPGWEQVVSFTQMKSLALVGGKFIFGVLDLDLNKTYLFAALLLVALFVAVGIIFVKRKQHQEWTPLFFLFAWLVVPILTAWCISFVVPVVQPKRVLFSLPALYLLLSYIVVRITEGKKVVFIRIVSIAALCSLLVVNLLSTLSYFTQPKYQREDWRSMHQLISQKYSHTRSIAVFGFTEAFAPWVWYNTDHFPTLATGVLSTDSVTDLPVLKKINDYQYVLVFDYLRDLTDPHHKIEAVLKNYGYHEVDQITPSTPLGIVHVYAKTDSVIGLNTVE